MTQKSQLSTTDLADRASRRRTRILWAQGVLFFIWQAAFFLPASVEGQPQRLVDQVRISAWAVWATALLVLLATGGGFFRKAEVRRLMNDEVSLANRRAATSLGFFASAFLSIVLFAVAHYDSMTAIEAIHAILSFGIAVALLRFAQLERRSERAA